MDISDPAAHWAKARRQARIKGLLTALGVFAVVFTVFVYVLSIGARAEEQEQRRNSEWKIR